MSTKIEFKIDGKKCAANAGELLVKAAAENGVYIPTLCNYEGLPPKASCRICTVKMNGRLTTACTTPVSENMEIENDTEELKDLRKSIVELMFTEGNHFCPACEKGGKCELQGLGYRYQMLVPRFPNNSIQKILEAQNSKLIIDQNRCILCTRCVRGIVNAEGKNLFTVKNRGHRSQVVLDSNLGDSITEEVAQQAMDICPVGSILVKEIGFDSPIGTRKFDNEPIGSEI